MRKMKIVGHIKQEKSIAHYEYWPVYYDGENAFITREGFSNPSMKWRLIGAVSYNNNGTEARRYSLSEVLSGGIEYFYKNKKQKVFLMDVDHGTTRQQGSGIFIPKK